MGRSWWVVVTALSVVLMVPGLAQAEDNSDDDDSSVEMSTVAELGFNGPVYHRIQFSQDGTYFDYVDEGGQDVLFPFVRLSVEAGLGDSHRLIFLWQPLELETRVRLNRDVVVDEATFEEATPVELLYSFPFYRISYLYDLADSDHRELAIGGSLQVRNATIGFEAADGSLRRDRRDVGLVPILKFRWRHTFDNQWFLGTEADGFYAPVRYLNVSDSDVLGAIWDVSFRAGHEVSDDIDAFLNLRYLGGGADGTSSDAGEGVPGDGFNRNWLHLVTLSLGFQYHLR